MNENSIINTNFSESDLKQQAPNTSLNLKNSQEIAALANKLDITNANSVMHFGQTTANEISHFADEILHSIENTTIEDSGTLLIHLNKIMNKFDVKDFEESKQGFLTKILKKAHKSMEILFKKYHTMGREIDKIYLELIKYKSEINSSNRDLQKMFDKNIEYYKTLEKYISAGNLVIDKLKNQVLPGLHSKSVNSVDQLDTINLSNTTQILEMLEQRVYDLELAKNISVQTMPQIKLIQKGNYNLVRKIHSAFIITIPIFKQCLTHAITLKRQEVQSKAISALDKRTNELLIKNAENTALQSKLIAKLASGNSIEIDTLEKTWATIVKGVEETKQIELEAKMQRKQGKSRLYQLQKDFQTKIKK